MAKQRKAKGPEVTPEFLRGAVAMFRAIDAARRVSQGEPDKIGLDIEQDEVGAIADALGIPHIAIALLAQFPSIGPRELREWQGWDSVETFTAMVGED